MEYINKKLNFVLFCISFIFNQDIYLCAEDLIYQNNVDGKSKIYTNEKYDIKNHIGILEPNLKRLKEIANELFPEGEPGASILIKKGDKIIFEEYYGLTTLPKGPKTDKNIRFNIASVSKQFTSVAILQLVSKGLISLEEKSMDYYFPEYKHPLWKKIKVKHLLSHSSGIPDARGYLTKEQKIHGNETLALEYLNWLNYTHFEPGTNYEYVNPTYVLLGRLVERISGQNFTNYVEEHIFSPANMTQTAYIFQEQNPAHAYEYDRDSGDSEESGGDRPEGPHNWYKFEYGQETFFGTRPDGGIYTTPRDFVKWEKALPSLLPESILQEAYKPHTYVYGSNWSDYQNRPDTWYGYGWFIEPKKQCIYHTGDNGGFKILASRYPKNETLALVFAARADWDRYGLKTKIEELLHFVSKVKNNVIFIRQIQMIDKKLKIFALINYPIYKNETYKFHLQINSKNEENIEFRTIEDYNGKFEKIIEFSTKEEFEEDSVFRLKNLINNYDIETKFNENNNNLDTEKVKSEIKSGQMDYNKIPSEYKIYHYSINDATNGCDFSLNSIDNIQESNKTINLNFIEVDDDNIINAECNLSSDNKNNIICKLNTNIDNNYFLIPYIYSDNYKSIIISQIDTNNFLPLKCSIPESSKLSTIAILAIVFGSLGGLSLIIIIYFIIKNCKGKKENEINNAPLINDLDNDN